MSLTPQDKLEIQELSSKYAIAMDEGKLEDWMQTWAKNGIWEGGVGKFAGENLKDLLPTLGDRIRGKRHIMTNFVITGEGNFAEQKCYLLIIDIAKKAMPGTALYLDKLEKIDGNWLFVERKVTIDMAPV